MNDGNSKSSGDMIRDQIFASAREKDLPILQARDRVADEWCREHGKSKDELSIEDILAIRSLPQWKNPI